MINGDFEVAKIFNELYINIVEKTCCCSPETLGCRENPKQDEETVENIVNIIKHFKEHPSIKEIKKYYSSKEPIKLLSFPETREYIDNW